MKHARYKGIVDNLLGDNKFYKFTMLMMIVTCIILALVVYGMNGKERTVVIPATLSKSFWVDDDHVSREYLEQMGIFLAQLELSVTPNSYKYQTDTLLKYVHPSAYGALQLALAENGEKLARDNSATWYTPRLTQVDSSGKRLAITGDLITFISDKQVSKVSKTYLLEFVYTNAKLYLKTFTEANENDPFNLNPATPKVAASGTPAT
ncbi:MAG: type IV conjugative transfer system protein TraE [Sulfuricaulis sp.]